MALPPPEREEFVGLVAGPFRHELLVHCYRMLGSFQDAEDMVQDAFLRGWRAFDQYDAQRASLRTWLYRIATNVCLTALKDRARRRLPSEVVARAEDPEAYPTQRYPEATWVTPFPDLVLGPESEDPAAVVAERTAIRLAFVAALQHLPPRQRAALILRDVLAWKSAEVADLLETTPIAVNSALQRARSQLAQIAPVQEDMPEPDLSDQHAVLSKYVAAFEKADVPALTQLLREDAIMEMPPWLTWLSGRDDIGRFMARIFSLRQPDAWRMVSTCANRQPAVGAYVRGADGTRQAQSLQVYTITSTGIARIVAFSDPSLFSAFGLPAVLTE
jgi:RNA polymerase sigma-70 factor (ECF subfamily)